MQRSQGQETYKSPFYEGNPQRKGDKLETEVRSKLGDKFLSLQSFTNLPPVWINAYSK